MTPNNLNIEDIREHKHKESPLPKTFRKLLEMTALTAALTTTTLSNAQTTKTNPPPPEEIGIHIAGGYAFFPWNSNKSGAEVHVAYVLGDENNLHIELNLIDAGFAKGTVDVNTVLPYSISSLPQTEWHIGSGAGIALPLSKTFEFSLGAGLALGSFHHGNAIVGKDHQGAYYQVNEETKKVPLFISSVELSARIINKISLYGAFAPHVNLAPMHEDVENPQTPRVPNWDLPLILGLKLDI